MCGICGIWQPATDDRASVSAMVNAMHHRGPDDRGIMADQKIILGMTRLAIIDTTMAGHQPMHNPTQTISIVYNGELYNFQSERQLLEQRGHTFSSQSDTEVVLKMYEEFGDDFVLRMRGIFAIAIYDRRRGSGKERLLLARDQMGIKPLLYAVRGGRLIFASELKALLASGLIEPEIDPVALRLLLRYGSVNQPRTILRNVSALPPAHQLIVEGNEHRLKRYWSLALDRDEGLRVQRYEAIVESVATRLEEAVQLQMISDVPLGAFLSGGIDSSLLVALMARHSAHPVKTYSVGFEAEGQNIDETDAAQLTADFIGTNHTRVIVRGSDVRDRIERIAEALDQPSVDGVNSYFVSLAASKDVTVAISGTGGDELFAGYHWFASMVLDEKLLESNPWRTLAKSIVSSVARRSMFDGLVQTRLGAAPLNRLRNSAGFVARYATRGIFQVFDGQQVAGLLSSDLRHKAQTGRSAQSDLEMIDELTQGSMLERVTGACLRGYTNNQLLRDIDAVSMSHSLEVRVPFLDPVVVDTALSLPDAVKLGLDVIEVSQPLRSYRESGSKRILLDVARNHLPTGFDGRAKRGFAMPFDSWLQNQLREVLDDTLSPRVVRERGLFEPTQVTTIRDSSLTGSVDWSQPWLLMMIELWCREVLDQSSQRGKCVA
jgi:asparagine synthase (glutamine-hydrolysing)